MLKTGDPSLTNEFVFQGFRLDTGKRCLVDPGGNPVNISSRAFDILKLLVEHRGVTLSKNFLVEKVWPNAVVEENNLNQAISSLRKALDDSTKNSRFIQTVTGRGYCFIAELDDLASVEIPASESASAAMHTDLPLNDQLHYSPGSLPWLLKSLLRRHAISFSLLILLMLTGTAYLVKSERDSATGQTYTGAQPVNSQQATGSSFASLPRVIPYSIAVMPLTNLTVGAESQPAQNIFASGLNNELLHQLGNIDNLTLISQENFLTPGIDELPIADITRLLNVESLVTGTIVFEESRARIILQVLDSQTGVILWSHAYELSTEKFDDMLQMQSEIAWQIANVVHGDAIEKNTPATAKPTNSYEAYRYNVAARLAFNLEDYSKTWSLANKSLGMDPEYVGALYNFSKANSFLAIVPKKGMSAQSHQQLAYDAAQRIIELAPDIHDGYLLKAHALASAGHWKEAMEEVTKSRELGAPLWDNYLLAPLLLSLGDFQEAKELLETNLTVQPINAYGRGLLLVAYEAAGNSLQARQEYEIGEELNPQWWGDSVNIFLSLGRKEKVSDVEGLYKVSPALKTMLNELNSGDIDTLRSTLNQLQSAESWSSAEYIFNAALAAAIGDHDLAISFMQKSTMQLKANIFWYWLPVFRDTRQTIQFRNLLAEIGLVAYWREFGWPAICSPQGDSFICN